MNTSNTKPTPSTPSRRRPLSTRENDNFVSDYFKQSRLHFIGCFRHRYESMMAIVASRLGVQASTLLQRRQLDRRKRKNNQNRIIAHVDLDCFFASIAILKNPDLKGKPIVVCHGHGGSMDESRGGEIASASYEAREYGIHAGILFGEARRLCPNVIAVPYDFESYEEVSIKLYCTFFSLKNVVVEAMSVDEAYLDLTDALADMSQVDSMLRELRSRIFKDTGCTASAGAGPCKLIARLATDRAKPNGHLVVDAKDAYNFVSNVKLGIIPGIGWRTRRRLEEMHVSSVEDLRQTPLQVLQSEFGENQGILFHGAVRGKDDRVVEPLKPRKSIGVDCGWGVRFEPNEDAKVYKFIRDMVEEVVSRLEMEGATGRRVTYKVMRKKKNAVTPHKFLGHGPCDIFTKFGDLQGWSDVRNELTGLCLRLHKEIGCPHDEFRGVGIKLGDIQFASLSSKSGKRKGAIENYFGSKEKFAVSAQGLCSNQKGEDNVDASERAMREAVHAHRVPDVPLRQEAGVNHGKSSLGASLKKDAPSNVGKSSEIEDKSKNRLKGVKIPNGLDTEVFLALPLDIQKEIINETRKKRMREMLGASKTLRKSRKGPKQKTLTALLSSKGPTREDVLDSGAD